MLAYAGVCWRMLSYAGWRMLTYADACLPAAHPDRRLALDDADDVDASAADEQRSSALCVDSAAARRL